jgi:hypothetical protein
MSTAIKLPFKCEIYDTEPVFVENPFSGRGCTLTPEAVAVYDVIRGAEMLGQYELVRQGLDWFREHFPAEYMTLLD